MPKTTKKTETAETTGITEAVEVIKNTKTPEAPRTITEKITELDQALEWFYGEDFHLDQAVAKYQSATKLAAEINHELAELKNQVELIEDFTKS